MANDGYGAIRVSYSILNSWAKGDIDRAVAPYIGIKDIISEISDALSVKTIGDIESIVGDTDFEGFKDYEIDGKIYKGISSLTITSAKAIAVGKKKHEAWEKEARRCGRLPRRFGGRKLISPQLELNTKKIRKLNDWCYLSGVLDVLDGDTAIDYKTGKTPANDYLNSRQHECYQILYPNIKRFEYHCCNHHLRRKDDGYITVAVAYLNKQTLKHGIEWVLTMAAELREYLINNGMGDRLDQGKGFEQ